MTAWPEPHAPGAPLRMTDLPDGRSVHVPEGDVPHMAALRSERGERRRWVFSLPEGDAVRRVEVDGTPWAPARRPDWDDVEMD